MTVVRDQLFPQKPPCSRFRFSRTGVHPSPGSSTIELPSAFAESGAYPPDRELPGSPRQCSLPLACRHPPESHQIGARKRRTPENTILSQPYRRRVSTDRPNRKGSQFAASLEGEPGPTPAGKDPPTLIPRNQVSEGEGTNGITYSKSKDQPGKVANPARGQLNRENEKIPYPRSRLRIWSRETVFGRPVPRQPAHLHTQTESGTYSRDCSRFPRRRPFIFSNHHTPSGQSRVYRVTQVRTDGVHCRESAGTRPVVLKVVLATGAAVAGHHGRIALRLSFPTPAIGMKWAC